MRSISLLFIFITIQLFSFAQSINYTISSGYENDISKDDYKKIVDISLPVIAKRYTIDFIKDGEIHLKTGQEMKVLNLHNLIVKCVAEKDKSNWKEVIEGHFNNLFISFDEQKKIDPTNYETIKKYLSIRIYPKESIEQRGGVAKLISKTDIEGTYTILMLDLPSAFSAVNKDVFDLWKTDIVGVFKIAQENIDKQQITKSTKTFDIGSAKNIEVTFIGNYDYAASYALNLINNSPELVGEWGSAIAIPNKGLVNLCKISKAKPVDFVKFIQLTKPLIEKSYKEHPQKISDQYFWYYKGKFTKINVLTNETGNIKVISPFGLTELMTEHK